MAGITQDSLAQISEAYYTATEEAKLSDVNPSDGSVLPYSSSSCYSKDEFQKWVKQIDIYDLEQRKANFYVDEAIVTKFTIYRNKVAAQLTKHAEYDGIKLSGQLKNIGSCQDGSKVGKMNEADSLYVLDEDIIVERTKKDGPYRIFWEQKTETIEIKPRCIREQFTNDYEKVLLKTPLPDCLRHAGYMSPAYSGLRYNGPAATSQFLTEDNNLNMGHDPGILLGWRTQHLPGG